MDCNNYSYAPHMLDEITTNYRPCDRVTIERRTANGHEYYIVFDNTNGGSNKAYNLKAAINMAQDWIKNGT